ncbi:HRDC-like protein [Cladochytrium replicatum]|nr:HRDC-like protein [Cladochytrium replicatum]
MAASLNVKRLRRGQVEETDANVLQFGEEFNGCQCMMTSEVSVVLTFALDRISTVQNGSKLATDVIQKSAEYCSKFGKFANAKTTTREIRNLFPPGKYSEFEIAQLGTLLPESAEEAKLLIPSLHTKDEEELDTLLRAMMALKKYQGTSGL